MEQQPWQQQNCTVVSTEHDDTMGLVMKFLCSPFSAGDFSLQPLCSVQAFSGPAESEIVPGIQVYI
jgi:hypothetical protein